MPIGNAPAELFELPDDWVDIVQPLKPNHPNRRTVEKALQRFIRPFRDPPWNLRIALTDDPDEDQWVLRIQGLEISVLAFQEELRHLRIE